MREFRLLVNDNRPGLSDLRWASASDEIRGGKLPNEHFARRPIARASSFERPMN
jgi:hypothetical protein